MAIKIYGDLGSGSFRRVATAAKIMSVDYEHRNVDLFKGESHTPEFLKLNPHGLTPVLRKGDTIIWEPSAINIYLAEKVHSLSWASLPGNVMKSFNGCSGRVSSGAFSRRSCSMSVWLLAPWENL